MNIFENRWSKFKQEILPIIFLTTLNTWFLIRFPIFMKFGAVSGTIVTVLNSVLGIICVVLCFTFADKFAGLINFNLDALDILPFGNVIKICNKIMYAVVFPGIYIFVWYKDFYHMPTIFYVLTFIISILFLILWLKAVSREPLGE